MRSNRILWLGFALIGVTAATYSFSLRNDFVELDDNIYVFRNPHVKAGLTKDSLVYACTTFDSGNWIPVVWLSYLADAACFGIRPAPFHAVNVAIHCVNVALVFVWLSRWTGAVWRSFAVAALFAVHPLHVESVAWVSERKDLLSLFFFLCMLLAYDSYSRRPDWKWYLLVLTAYMLGLLSKSMLVTAPLLLWLMDVWPGSRWDETESARESPAAERSMWLKILDKVPLLLSAVAIGLITIRAQGAGPTTAFTSWERIPAVFRLGNAVTAYGWYLMKTACPTGLCVMYSHPMLRLSWFWAGVSAIVLSGISVLVVRAGQQRRFLLFGWLWFLIAILPVIGLLQVGTQAYADRYSYLPQIGLWIALVWQIERWLRGFPSASRIGGVLLTVVVVVFALVSVRQIGYWKDTETLWKRALAASPENWEAHRQWGSLCLEAERLDEAYDHFENVLRWNPKLPDVYANLGWIHQIREQWIKAEQRYTAALALSPGHEFAMHNLMLALRQQRRAAEALPYLERYTKRRPLDVKMRNELGLIYARSGNFEAARVEFVLAEKAAPDDLPTQTNLGLALAQLGRPAEARPHLAAVAAQQPDSANARVNLGVCLESLGILDEARREFEAAVQLNPNDQDARSRLQRLQPSGAGPE